MDQKKMPKLALGAWAWGVGAVGGNEVFGNAYTEEQLKPVFAKAVEHGLNLWDTAVVYGMGASETVLGDFIKEYERKNIILSTKFTPQIADETPSAMQNMLDGSLKRLHTDYIDVYWIHNPADVEKWTPELIPLFKSGQVKSVGVSNHNLKELKRANEILAKEGIRISAVQNHYSLLNRTSEQGGLLDYCKDNGITFYAYMVLEQGALTGRYDSAHPFPANCDRAIAYNSVLDKLETLIAKMKEIGNRYNATPAQIATAWAIAKGTLPIIGVTKVNHVEDALKAIDIKLTASDIAEIEILADSIGVSSIRGWEKSMS